MKLLILWQPYPYLLWSRRKRVRKAEKHREVGFSPSLPQDATAFPVAPKDSKDDTRTDSFLKLRCNQLTVDPCPQLSFLLKVTSALLLESYFSLGSFCCLVTIMLSPPMSLLYLHFSNDPNLFLNSPTFYIKFYQGIWVIGKIVQFSLLDSALHLCMKKCKCEVKGKLLTRLASGSTTPPPLTNIKMAAYLNNWIQQLGAALDTNVQLMFWLLQIICQQITTSSNRSPLRSMLPHPTDFGLGCLTCLGLMERRICFPVSCCGQWGADICDASRGLGSITEKNMELLLPKDTSSLNQTCKLEPHLAESILDQLQQTDRCVSKK